MCFAKPVRTALILGGLLCGSVHAAPTAYFGVDPRNPIPNTVANGLIADGEGVDWTAAVFVIDLTQGSVYNGTPNSDRPQDGFWGIPGFDILEWDTWVGVPGGVNDVGPLGAGDLGSPALSLSGNLISVAWGGTATTNTGPTRIANLTFSPDATGTWQLLVSFAGNVIVQQSGVMVGGAVALNTLPPPWPEPGTLAVMTVGMLALARRRRKSNQIVG